MLYEDLEVETVPCNLCGGNENSILFESKDRLHGIQGVFNVVKCKTCGLVYINPRPTKDSIKTYYPNGYRAYKGAFLKNNKNYIYNLYNKDKYKKIEHFLRKGRMLDIGCGDGSFLRYMKNYNWDVFGVEKNEFASDYGIKELGLNIFSGELLEAKFPDAFFDIVTLWAVLEHLHDPLTTLMEINRILKCGGLLIFNTQNFESLESRVFKNRWYHLDSPRHLYNFSPNTIEKLLSKSKFDILKIDVYSAAHMSGIPGSVRYMIFEQADKTGVSILKYSNLFFQIAFLAMLKPICYLENKLGNGEVIEAYAIKPK